MSRRLHVLGVAVALVAGAAVAAAPGGAAPPSLARPIEAPASLTHVLERTWTAPNVDPGADTFELVPAIRPPTSTDGRVRILVFLSLAEPSRIRLVDGGLTLPPATLAIRVEAFAPETSTENERDERDSRILDVRATRLADASGPETFYLLRPSARADTLRGFAWPRSDDGARDARLAIERGFAAGAFGGNDDARDRAARASAVVRLNDCAGCHRAGRPDRPSVDALVQKGTDASAFFQVRATLVDLAPIEQYRPRNPTLDDPFVELVCREGSVPRGASRCANGDRPLARKDIPRALAAGDDHAKRVCASRRALLRHADEDVQRAFARQFEECALSGSALRTRTGP